MPCFFNCSDKIKDPKIRGEQQQWEKDIHHGNDIQFVPIVAFGMAAIFIFVVIYYTRARAPSRAPAPVSEGTVFVKEEQWYNTTDK